MINNWFECKVRYEKTLENGMDKKVTETYLVDALSFTEAEARIIEEVGTGVKGVFEVKAIKIANYQKFVCSYDCNDDKYFKCQIAFISLDEKSGSEKETKFNLLVEAANIDRAKEKIINEMKDSMQDYKIISVAETSIVEVFPYNKEDLKNNNGY